MAKGVRKKQSSRKRKKQSSLLRSPSKRKRAKRQMKKYGEMKLWEWLLIIGAVIVAFLFIILIMPEFWGQSEP